MLIDLHLHTEGFSPCSRIPLVKGVERAREMGLDGICLTEHDVFHRGSDIAGLEKKYRIRIFIGTEILTVDGDILCYGLDSIPRQPVTAAELTAYLASTGGASIAAHPFRKNNRGVKGLFASLPDLTAVEAWNGNTSEENNRQALNLARSEGIAVTGASDSHFLDRIGCFATEFPGIIASTGDLCRALRSGDFQPVRFSERGGSYERIIWEVPPLFSEKPSS